jgi:hypothetical protein
LLQKALFAMPKLGLLPFHSAASIRAWVAEPTWAFVTEIETKRRLRGRDLPQSHVHLLAMITRAELGEKTGMTHSGLTNGNQFLS